MTSARILSTLVAAGALLLADPALAAAEPSVQVVGGRERIKIAVAGTEYPADRCLVDPDSERHTQSLPVPASGTLVAEGIAAGQAHVMVWCPQGGVIWRGYVEVQPGNPVLDLQDRAFAAAGSSDRVTDPALR
ncbi:hypothetical protein [Nocardia sp. NPDC127526]|uniref:hypothetical protein n=1 Tax=Nocardia sp. NPDC127526 TaxID=3345393 RepID=UPI0036377276